MARGTLTGFAGPRYLICLKPLVDDHAIWTAVLPEGVFTVRMLATAPLYNPGQCTTSPPTP